MRRFVMEANDYMRMVEKGQKWPEALNGWKLQGVTIEFIQPNQVEPQMIYCQKHGHYDAERMQDGKCPWCPNPMPAWLGRQFDNAEATVATWPESKRVAAGIPSGGADLCALDRSAGGAPQFDQRASESPRFPPGAIAHIQRCATALKTADALGAECILTGLILYLESDTLAVNDAPE
jgi:hypothetical protein